MFTKKVLFVVALVAALASLNGCSIKSVEVRTLTIQPQKQPVTITAKGTAVCQDYFLFFRVTENLDVRASNGQMATKVERE
ncbi:MAG: hypothetical protein ACYC7L_13095 [Nitrospirota bacterium]